MPKIVSLRQHLQEVWKEIQCSVEQKDILTNYHWRIKWVFTYESSIFFKNEKKSQIWLNLCHLFHQGIVTKSIWHSLSHTFSFSDTILSTQYCVTDGVPTVFCILSPRHGALDLGSLPDCVHEAEVINYMRSMNLVQDECLSSQRTIYISSKFYKLFKRVFT